MSIANLWQRPKLQRLIMNRWRPARELMTGNPLLEARKRRLRSLIEPLENRCMLSVAALTDNPAAVTSTSFVAGNLLVPQFNTTGGKTLLKAEVQYKIDLASVLAATGTNPTTDPATLQGDLNVFANLTVPGASAGNPAGATANPQGVTLVASPSVPLPPGSVDVPISYSSETAQPGVGHINKTLIMTGAQAGAAGYVGAGTNPFARVAGGTATLSIVGGPTGTIVGGWATTVNFSADPLYYYYVPAAISGIKFQDSDFGADKDAGEPGLSGWTININGTAEDIVDAQLNVLLAGGAVSASVVTGAGGAYSFTNLKPGTYTITETPQAGFINTFPVGGSYTVTIAADGTATVGSLTNNDFGNVNPVERANISIGPDGVNPVGANHTFTVVVNYDDGKPAGLFGGDAVNGFAPASGVAVTVNLDGQNGAIPNVSAPVDLAPADPSVVNGNTNASGQLAVTFTSATAGLVVGNAFATVNGIAVDTDPATITTAGPGGSGPANKTFVSPGEIRMTGGGSVYLPAATYSNHIVGESFGNERRITHGFELHCGTGSDITQVNNHIEINWGSPNQHFHLLYLTAIDCPNDPNIDPPPPPFTTTMSDTLVGAGVGRYSGTFSGRKYHNAASTLTFILTDAGEPGTKDTASYIVTVLDGNQDGVANDPKIVLNTGDTVAPFSARTIADFNALATPFTLVPPTTKNGAYQVDIPGQLFIFKGNQQVHPELKKLTTTQVAIQKDIVWVFNQLDNANLSLDRVDKFTADLLALFAAFDKATPKPIV